MSKKTCFIVCPIGEDNSDIRKHTEQTMEERLMAILLPEMIKNPDSLAALANLSQTPPAQT